MKIFRLSLQQKHGERPSKDLHHRAFAHLASSKLLLLLDLLIMELRGLDCYFSCTGVSLFQF
uniref:Uncharacterized protein n=1 Tax=Manihot esculenta TaxID=3983 RepID=A0A2C9V2N9_MANES